MVDYKVGDIIRWNINNTVTGFGTYGKVLVIKDNKIKIAYLDLEESPDNGTDWKKAKVIPNSWITNENGYSPLTDIYEYSKLFKSENNITIFNRVFINGPIGICASEIECSEKYPLCNCPTSQLMLKGCTCGGS